MPDRISYAEAADILGCHISNVAKLIRRGDLHSQRRRDAALDRAEVEALATERRGAKRVQPSPRVARERLDPRPDTYHEWLTPDQVAAMVGITPQGVTQRLRRGKMPGVSKRRRWWVRADQLENHERARLARKTHRP